MFSPETSKGNTPSLIPDKTLHFAIVAVQGINTSKNTGGSYGKLELILIDGPYHGRRVYTIIMNPADPKTVNKDQKMDGATMGLTSLTRAFEACRIFDENNPSTYKALDGLDFAGILERLNGKRVAIKIKITEAKDGYDAKNEVSEWLTPNKGSRAHIDYLKLIGGKDTVEQARSNAFVAPAPAQAGFLQRPQQTNQSAAPSWVDTNSGPLG